MTTHDSTSWFTTHRWIDADSLTGELACADCGLTISMFADRFAALYNATEAVRDALAAQHGAYSAFPVLPPGAIDDLNTALDAAVGG